MLKHSYVYKEYDISLFKIKTRICYFISRKIISILQYAFYFPYFNQKRWSTQHKVVQGNNYVIEEKTFSK